MTAIVGIDIGGTKLLACVVDDAGKVRRRFVRPTGRATGPREALELIGEIGCAIRRRVDLAAVGIGFPGLVDHGRGAVRSSVMLDGWRDVPLAHRVAELLGVPCTIDNDVNAAALAELARRRGGPPGGMLFVAVGTGVGGAIALGGRLWRGATGVAGEIGNTTIARDGPRCWCGRRGCLNVLASGTAIEDHLGVGRGALAMLVARREPRALAAVAAAAAALGIGVANAMNLLNPALVVFGGGVGRLGADFLAAIERTARAEAFPEAAEGCRFELARAGYEASAVGAALLARHEARAAGRVGRCRARA
jgi:glucokinase